MVPGWDMTAEAQARQRAELQWQAAEEQRAAQFDDAVEALKARIHQADAAVNYYQRDAYQYQVEGATYRRQEQQVLDQGGGGTDVLPYRLAALKAQEKVVEANNQALAAAERRSQLQAQLDQLSQQAGR